MPGGGSMRRDNEGSMTGGTPETGAGEFEFTPDKIQSLVTSTYAPVKRSAPEQVARWFTKLIDDGPGRVTYEFQQLTQKLHDHGRTSDTWAAHKIFNRYHDMPCFDVTRVSLLDGLSPSYVHANYVDGYCRKRAYILMQGPLDSTIIDLWRMVWQENLSIVVMLARFEENGRAKCARYFPLHSATDMHVGPFRISLVKFDSRKFCKASLFRVKNTLNDEVRHIGHVWYVLWPDKGVPEDVAGFRAFVNYARLINASINNAFTINPFKRGPPMAIHCSAGIGRSAVFALLDFMTEAIMHGEFPDPLDVISDMRKQRYHFIHTKDQLLFVYDYLVQLGKHARHGLIVE